MEESLWGKLRLSRPNGQTTAGGQEDCSREKETSKEVDGGEAGSAADITPHVDQIHRANVFKLRMIFRMVVNILCFALAAT